MVLALLPFFLFGCVVIGVLIFAPGVIDLVMRTDPVSRWWATPFVLLLLPLIGTLGAPFLMDYAHESATMAAFGWAMIHLGAAGLFLVLGLSLAAARGLRPGGPTQRRRRTSVAAILFLLLVLLVPWLPGGGVVFWVTPAALGGILWVIGVNRRGPSRLERGKAVSAGMLVAASVQLLFGFVHLSLFFDLESTSEALAFSSVWLPASLLLGAMILGVRLLTEGIPSTLPLIAVLSGASLVFPIAWWAGRDRLPAGIEVPKWVDLSGAPGGRLRATRTLKCLWKQGEPKAFGSPCFYTSMAAFPPETPLSEVRDSPPILVVRGDRYLTNYERWKGEPLRVREVNGLAQVGDDPELYTVGLALHNKLREVGLERPLRVRRTPNWSIQQYVSMCASTGDVPDCELVDPGWARGTGL